MNLPLRNKDTEPNPWCTQIGDNNYQIEPFIHKEGKEYVTSEKDKYNKEYCHLQKDEEKRLSLNALQIKLTYYQLIVFEYKLQKLKI